MVEGKSDFCHSYCLKRLRPRGMRDCPDCWLVTLSPNNDCTYYCLKCFEKKFHLIEKTQLREHEHCFLKTFPQLMSNPDLVNEDYFDDLCEKYIGQPEFYKLLHYASKNPLLATKARNVKLLDAAILFCGVDVMDRNGALSGTIKPSV